MLNALLATKKNMTSGYDARGRRVGVTVLEVTPNLVTQIKNAESKDGYSAIQIGMGEKKSVKKPQIGHFKKAGIDKKIRFLHEVRTEETDGVSLGQEVKVGDVFKVGDAVKITGTSKGKGFQGGVRRHGFHGGPKTHGQSDRHRAPGSIGAGTTPGRVYKGKKMAGHMGVETVSYKGIEVIAVDRAANLITLKGGVPGPSGGLVILQNIGVIKGYTAPPEEKPEEEEENAEAAVEETPIVEETASAEAPVVEEGTDANS